MTDKKTFCPTCPINVGCGGVQEWRCLRGDDLAEIAQLRERKNFFRAEMLSLVEENGRLRASLEDVKAHCEERNYYLADAGLVYRLAEAVLYPPPRKPDLDDEIKF